ncbi:L-glutamate gamma-semialdehyde dehydrogenase [Chamaesiphon minutus]|uniref:L-glutamate gamma-semialdehyde dehydrogenase n=1 Tax=Chamaesiphon minutus (strain ATCC 27169 / PCC 6605) TaxID=1173020 RepID=K9ULL5_CHAP6|nr:L-glutamate gamma-semialdehyde dehydrogenase [Chamaesiphon minutus]AFY95997.1 delta-1-pyrroline-5-carboxylate dehydrogenase, group 2, putative [Chamaesiphon minutus PCC 6605]
MVNSTQQVHSQFDTNLDIAKYESKTQEIARQLLGETTKSSIWSKLSQIKDELRFDDKLMAWTMENEGLRVQLFRLIDCLPALQSKAEIARHMQEYLANDAVEVPAMRSLLNFSTDNPNSLTATAAATTLSTAIATLAKRYICGENLPAATKTIERLRRERLAFTMDLLGEAVISEVEAEGYLDRYLTMMENLAARARNWPTIAEIDRSELGSLDRVQVSVKLSAFYSQFDPLDPVMTTEKVSEPVRRLLRKAQAIGCGIHFDMEQYEFKSLTLQILKQVLMEPEFVDRTNVGLTIQGYLRDSEADLYDLIAWAKERAHPVTVRLVKGAYWDRETIRAYQQGWAIPVFSDKVSTDANYERLTQILLENHQYLHAAIGSHNARSLAKAIAIVQTLNIPSSSFEVQCLYGMGDEFAKKIVDLGYRVRIYCPFGELIPGMSYLIRRLLENTANSSFLRMSSSESRAISELVAAPVMTDRDRLDKGTLATTSFEGFTNASDRDYAIERQRTAAQTALQTVRDRLGKTYLPIIDDRPVQTEEYIESVNPANSAQVVGKIGLASIEQADAAVKSAKNAWTTWKQLSARHRGDILRKAADLMEAQRDELTAWITWEVAKPIREGDAEVSEAIDFCRYYAREMERLESGVQRNLPGEDNTYIYQPRGVVVVISPWNFPLAIALGMSVAAIAAGNTVILKPAEQSSVIGAKIAEILHAAGLPPGVFTYLPAKGSTVGAHLVKHPDVHLIAFTGSQQVGCQIVAEAAILRPKQKHMKRVIAEMGGKNGIIIDESADLDQAVVGVMNSTFGFAGQKCSACSRAIVLAPVYDNFLDRLVAATRSLKVGAAHHADTKLSAVIDAAAQANIQRYIEIGKESAKLALSMPVPEGGYYVSPTIFSEVDPDSTIAQEEIFGPVLAVIKAENFDEALEIANGTNFALTGGLYSRTPSHIDRAYREFEVGNLYINRGITGALVDRHPFGGFKLSGVGSKAGGRDYLLQFLEPRSITENTQRQGFAPGDISMN